MSLLSAAAPYRRGPGAYMRVPVVMPVLVVEVDPQGLLTVALDGEPYSAEGSLTRVDLARVLDEVAADLDTAVRVEVRESDGSTFVDIVTPAEPRQQAAEALPDAPATVVGEVSGGGFVPGEEVAVAVVVAHQVAGSDGAARLRLPPALVEAHPGLVVFLSTRFGTVQAASGAS